MPPATQGGGSLPASLVRLQAPRPWRPSRPGAGPPNIGSFIRLFVAPRHRSGRRRDEPLPLRRSGTVLSRKCVVPVLVRPPCSRPFRAPRGLSPGDIAKAAARGLSDLGRPPYIPHARPARDPESIFARVPSRNMPETPEVQTVRRGLGQPAMVGAGFTAGRAAPPRPALSLSPHASRRGARAGSARPIAPGKVPDRGPPHGREPDQAPGA